MYDTSPEWKKNQRQPLTSESFVELSYKITDPNLPEAHTDAKDELPNLSEISEITMDVEREIASYATLERNLWLLDGSKITVPEEKDFYAYSGYISNPLCELDGTFVTPLPCINIKFEETVKSKLPGLTITWGSAHGDYPVEFSVTPYNGDSSYDPMIVNNTDVVSIVELEMDNFNEIKIEILKWCQGHRRARIGKIFLGINKIYTKSDLLQFSCSETIDPVSGSLPKYEIQFEIDNRDRAFNPTNPQGLTKYMMERQEIRTRYGYLLDGAVQWIPGGVYYLSDWNAPQNGISASFTARDLFEFLGETYYKGAFPSDINGASALDECDLYTLAEQVLREAPFPKDKIESDLWELDESLREVNTRSPLPVCSMAECLQLIANAAACSITFDRGGKLHIQPLINTAAQVDITDNNSYSKAEISLTKPIKQVDVSKYAYTEDSDKELYCGTLALKQGKNVFMLEYSDVAKKAKASIQVLEGAANVTSEKYYAKYCELTLDSESIDGAVCEVTVNGIAQKQTDTVIVIPNVDEGEVQALKNILITSESHARAIGNWLKDNLIQRKSFAVDPSLDVGDIVNINNGAIQNKMHVVSSSFSYGGAFKGKSEGSALVPSSSFLIRLLNEGVGK